MSEPLNFSRVDPQSKRVELHSPDFVFTVDPTNGLQAVAMKNLITGQHLLLGNGPELEVDVDSAEQRLWITGWKWIRSQDKDSLPEEDRGFIEGFHQPVFNDSTWEGGWHPAVIGFAWGWGYAGYTWTRTHLFLPAQAENKPLTLTLGGFGFSDYRYMRVFINGHELGVRRVTQRWHEPGTFDLGVGSIIYPHLRFGQENIIVLQLASQIIGPGRLDELDPKRAHWIPWGSLFEQYVTIGQPVQPLHFQMDEMVIGSEGDSGRVSFTLNSSDAPITAQVAYVWDSTQPVLHKFIIIENKGNKDYRLMQVRLGNYQTGVTVSEGDLGFPVYIGDSLFAGLAHPSGWATGQDGTVLLRQYPGKILRPGENFTCMEAVLGVAKQGKARQAFIAHLSSRMRRVVRDHQHAYAIFSAFGARPKEIGDETEEFLLDNLKKLGKGAKEAGYQFDYYNVDFWVDASGDLTRFDPERFPRGFLPIRQEINRQGMLPGLWIDSCMAVWTIGKNPVVGWCYTHDPSYGFYLWGSGNWGHLCRATDPVKTIYTNAFRYHTRENGVRLIKFDNLMWFCENPTHQHWPGVYSVEAIHNGVLEAFRGIDAECPEVFIMLYWGYRSPWWLLDADTLFEGGVAMEGANPGGDPTLYHRDSATIGLDQAQRWCLDIPSLGKDSLGVWLSDWAWNSSIGKEHWQEAFVMDICRGSLLAQIWSDTDWLSPPERKQINLFIQLMKTQQDCFQNPRFILGDPWKYEPYGYCCTDGKRAFIAINNCTWTDVVLPIELNSKWGLPEGKRYQLYRWYPEPTQLVMEKDDTVDPIFWDHTSIALRPFEVVLLEIFPEGEPPSLDQKLPTGVIPASFQETSQKIPLIINLNAPAEPLRVALEDEDPAQNIHPKRVIRVSGEIPPTSAGGKLAITIELLKAGYAYNAPWVSKALGIQGRCAGEEVQFQSTVPIRIQYVSWQTWHTEVKPGSARQSFETDITIMLDERVQTILKAYFLPAP